MFDGARGKSFFLSQSIPGGLDRAVLKYLRGDAKDRKFAANTWSMLYCGGSQPVLEQLKAFRKKSGINLSVEKFDW